MRKHFAPPRLMLPLLLIATWLRLWQFPALPPPFNYDEAYNVIDIRWLSQAEALWLFLPGNTGRQTLFFYLAGPVIDRLGPTPFALRFVSVVISLLVIPLVYRWVSAMFAPSRQQHWLGLLAAAGVTFSFWHLLISRSGFRASLLLLLWAWLASGFWLGWQRRSIGPIIGAGVALGLAQYTYWLAGLLPLHLALFALLWTILGVAKLSLASERSFGTLKQFWLQLTLVAITSAAIFAPLGYLYLTDPTILQYVSQSTAAGRVSTGQTTWASHLLTSLRITFDGPVGLWRGDFSQVLTFDWLAWAGFWLGLVVALRRWRQPAYLFLLTGFVVLWLPAPLNDIDFSDLRFTAMLPVNHAISFLRLAGILPIYYTLSGLGLWTGLTWLVARFGWRAVSPARLGPAALVLLVLGSGLSTTTSFFVRWPQLPYLSERYNGPEYALAQSLAGQLDQHDLLIPFHLFTHPTFHLVFDPLVVETDRPPASPGESAILVTDSTTARQNYVWVSRLAGGGHAAFITPLQEVEALRRLSAGPTTRYDLAAPIFITAWTSLIPNLAPLHPALSHWPAYAQLDYRWHGDVSLVGYELHPGWLKPGDLLSITLYWRPLIDQPITHDIFLHVVNSRGEGVGQLDGLALTNGHRWRAGRLTPTTYALQLGDSLPPGPYLLRLGLFNANSGRKLTASQAQGEPAGDQVFFGLFYVSQDSAPSPAPRSPAPATFDDRLHLLGFDPPAPSLDRPLAGETQLNLNLYWQAGAPVDHDYTIFVQLLDNQNQRVAGFDTQPLNGLYPTSHWQANEVVIVPIDVPLPPDLPPGDYRLVAGLYRHDTGERLPAVDGAGQPLAHGMALLEELTLESHRLVFR
jgi:hypothetical protein